LRYLKVLLRIFIPLAVLIIPILIPLNVRSGEESRGVTGLDRLSWINVAPKNTRFYWTHLCLSLVVVAWVCRVFWFELHVYTRLRQQRMVAQSSHRSGTTILVTNIPSDLGSSKALKEMYDIYPGGVRNVCMQRDYRKLSHKLSDRNAVALVLEAAETRLILKCLAASRTPRRYSPANEPAWRRYISPEDRQYCTLPLFGLSGFPKIPFVGHRVDLIEHYRSRLVALNKEIEDDRREEERFDAKSSALIQFNQALGATMACQSVHHPNPHRLTSKQVEESAEHILWANVSVAWKESYVRTFLVGAIITSLCSACVVPVAFTGLLSQLNYLATVWPWLAWLGKIPGWVQGVLQGVLPPSLLTTVTVLLPIILERLILEQGVHTDTSAELLLQDYYFGFLFLQIFLVVSISSTLAAVLSGLSRDFESLAALISLSLPKTGNYFFSYMLLQGLSVSAGSLLQLSRLADFVFGSFFDKTPRQKWERERAPERKWGTFFPVYTNLAAIGMIYSVVSPLILVFNIVTFSLFLIVEQYNLLNVSRFNTDTGGLIYPKAINQLFTGLYVMELYLVGLFFMVRDQQNRVTCAGQGVIMIAVFCLTAVYQVLLNQAYRPLFKNLPVMLEQEQSQGATEATDAEQCTPDRHSVTALGRLFSQLEIMNNIRGRVRLAFTLTAQHRPTIEDDSEVKDTALGSKQPVIWIPEDPLGVSKGEIEETKRTSDSILISNSNALLNRNAKILLRGGPPNAYSSRSSSTKTTRIRLSTAISRVE